VKILKALPHTQYHPEARLVTWHPCGVFDDELADRIVEFIESEERIAEAPFHRYTDFNGLTEIRLKFGHAFQIAEHRRAGYASESVKSAFVSDWVIGLGIARMYAALMEGAPIEVRAFRSRDAAAEWLGVPVDILRPNG
jgi:hypothetical protein